MTLEAFIEKHSMREINQSDESVPAVLCPWDEHDEDDVRFFMNEARTIGLGLNDSRELVRVVYAELGLADSGWMSRAEAFDVTGLE